MPSLARIEENILNDYLDYKYRDEDEEIQEETEEVFEEEYIETEEERNEHFRKLYAQTGKCVVCQNSGKIPFESLKIEVICNICYGGN